MSTNVHCAPQSPVLQAENNNNNNNSALLEETSPTIVEPIHQSTTSLLLLVKVRLQERNVAQDFGTNIVEQLITSKIANLWVLTPPGRQLPCYRHAEESYISGRDLDRCDGGYRKHPTISGPI